MTRRGEVSGDLPSIVITGKQRLTGEISVSGAKNAVLKLMAASLLTPEPCVIRNVPRIGDVLNMIEVLEGLGARCALDGDVLTIEAKELHPHTPDDPVREMRASIQVMGPLLGRLGEAKIALPGGCAIGARPIDLHLAGLRAWAPRLRSATAPSWGRRLGLRAGRSTSTCPASARPKTS